MRYSLIRIPSAADIEQVVEPRSENIFCTSWNGVLLSGVVFLFAGGGLAMQECFNTDKDSEKGIPWYVIAISAMLIAIGIILLMSWFVKSRMQSGYYRNDPMLLSTIPTVFPRQYMEQSAHERPSSNVDGHKTSSKSLQTHYGSLSETESLLMTAWSARAKMRVNLRENRHGDSRLLLLRNLQTEWGQLPVCLLYGHAPIVHAFHYKMTIW